MNATDKIVIGIIGGVALVGVGVYIYKHKKVSVATSAIQSSTGAIPAMNTPVNNISSATKLGSILHVNSGIQSAVSNVLHSVLPYTPDPLNSAPTDNYIVWSAAMIKQINDTGNVSVGATLGAQLKNAIYATGSIPIYSDQQVIAALPDGVQTNQVMLFHLPVNTTPSVPAPSGIGDNTQGVENMRMQLFLNCCIVSAILAKNYVAVNTHGQAVGTRQRFIRDTYTACKNNVANINNIPATATNMIGIYKCAQTDQWPVGYGGGDIPSAQITASQVLELVNTAAKIATLFI